jgi:hypothetical protein
MPAAPVLVIAILPSRSTTMPAAGISPNKEVNVKKKL